MTKTTVRVVRGGHCGRVGLIAGSLASQNRYATRAAVFIGADVAALKIADLEEVAQLELQLPNACKQKRRRRGADGV